jgi:hypothetical protein
MRSLARRRTGVARIGDEVVEVLADLGDRARPDLVAAVDQVTMP